MSRSPRPGRSRRRTSSCRSTSAGQIGTPERERSVKQLIGRVVTTITEWARKQHYFAAAGDLQAFSDDLKHLLVRQYGRLQQPGVVQLRVREGAAVLRVLHQFGLRHDGLDPDARADRRDALQVRVGHGQQPVGDPLVEGTARGRRHGVGAGVVHEGVRRVRRRHQVGRQDAARGEDGDPQQRSPRHLEFINCKVEEEKKAWALIDAGYDGSFTGPAYASVFFQNSNNSVRVTDEFMRAVLDDGEWQTHAVTTGQVMDTYRARDLMRQIAEGTHICGDPGMQFDTTINEWHTCPNTNRINASNPCSEYMFLDDSACNLASLNLMKFVDEQRRVRRRGVQGGGAHLHHRAGDHRRERELPDEGDRAQQPRLPPARARLREPRRAADVPRAAVRQRRGAGLLGGHHGAHDRRGVRAVGARGPRSRRPVRRATRRTASRSCA